MNNASQILLGTSATYLARRLGVHRGTVQRWRSGRQQPSPRNLRALREEAEWIDRLYEPGRRTPRENNRDLLYDTELRATGDGLGRKRTYEFWTRIKVAYVTDACGRITLDDPPEDPWGIEEALKKAIEANPESIDFPRCAIVDVLTEDWGFANSRSIL